MNELLGGSNEGLFSLEDAMRSQWRNIDIEESKIMEEEIKENGNQE